VGEQVFRNVSEALPQPLLLPQHLVKRLATNRAFSRVYDYLGCGRVTLYLRDF
jgi:hypothetical protein